MSNVLKSTALVTIEPVGGRTVADREHSIKVRIELRPLDARQADRTLISAMIRRALAVYAQGDRERDPRELREITSSRRGRDGAVVTSVIASEGSVVLPGRPSAESVDRLRAALHDDGYRAAICERRECVEPGCSTESMVSWNRPGEVLSGWFSNAICGRHDYRRCLGCHSVFRMTSTNAAGQAPSVHCEVCGRVLVEWGASKIWQAELVTRGAV